MVKRFANLRGPLANVGDSLIEVFKEKEIHLINIYPTMMRKIITYEFQFEVPIEWSAFGAGRKDVRPWRELTKADVVEKLLEERYENFIVEVAPGTTAKPVNDDKDWYVEARVYFLPRNPSHSD